MNYYCSQKFNFLTLDIDRKILAACCSAEPEQINLQWLKNNSGQLFNTPNLLQERQAMLDNKSVKSCEKACYIPESKGIISRRQIKSNDESNVYTSVQSAPETLNLVLNTNCNLTCSYCCKQYSTAWLKDISDNGAYLNDARFKITMQDKVVLKIHQSELLTSKYYQLFEQEIKNFTNLKKIVISGGEPFLYNNLASLLQNFNCEIDIFTGLGVNSNRFERMLLKLPKNIKLKVSAENVLKLYEFNRYGNTYENFRKNLELIKKHNFDFVFSSTLSNLTIHGFQDFQKIIGTGNDSITLCNDPDYLSLNVLDTKSKEIILQTKYDSHEDIIKQSILTEPGKEQKQNLKNYILEFARRRNLDLFIYPKHFIDWILA